MLLALVFTATLLLAGGTFAASRDCDGGVCKGTGGNEVLDGSPTKDVIYGLGGDDRVRDALGVDEVFGGPADDLVRASDGEQPDDRARDVLDCGAVVDTVYFIPGQDVVRANCEIRNPPEM